MTTWIVVAHKGGARFVDEHDEKLRIFETLDNPEARSSRGAALADGGSAIPPPPDSHGQRAPAARESQKNHAANAFAAQLADKLLKHRNAHHYDELVLIAAPRFLGVLRRALDSATAATVRGTLNKDFARISDHELLRRLARM